MHLPVFNLDPGGSFSLKEAREHSTPSGQLGKDVVRPPRSPPHRHDHNRLDHDCHNDHCTTTGTGTITIPTSTTTNTEATTETTTPVSTET